MKKDNMKKQNIEINIYGRAYSIKGDDKKYLLSLQDDLNDRIAGKKEMLAKYSELDVITMIALQILDEKKKIEREYKQLKDLAKKMELGSNKI